MKTLEVKNVCKQYPKFKLEDVSFSIEEGSICGFIGRNGAGKTTTLKGMMNLLHFDSGEVYVFGHNFFDDELENRQNISFSLSEINYFPDMKIGKLTRVTARFYKNWNQELYEKICKKFGLDQDKKVKALSSGMKVKYNLAIALSHDAKLLILDEPTSGLDPVSRDEILDIFKSLVKTGKRSILFSTHITSDLEKCADHIVYIKKGKIISSKTKEKFTADYKYIEGDISLFEETKDKLISYKKDEKTFTGLVRIENAKELNKKLKVSNPDLETVMVYEEKEGEEDEEFIF